MASPRVLFTSHAPVISGAEVVLLEVLAHGTGKSAFLFAKGALAEALRARGVDVRTSRKGGDLAAVKRDRSLAHALPLALPIAGLIAEIAAQARRHDMVYANSQKAFILSALATSFVRRPLIWHLHDIPDATHFGKAQLKLQVGLANRRASRVIVPSKAVFNGFVAAGGRADRVRIVPNGVKPPSLEARDKTTLRRDLALPSGPLVGVFSRLAPWKGQDVLLRAVAQLPGVSCIVAGGALFGEEAYAANLRALARELGIVERVHFLGSRNDVVSLMRAVDIVIHPSTSPEPFGLTLIEAMFAGTPIIATDIGAVPEILDGDRFGTPVAADDPEALAKAIEATLRVDQAQRVALARAHAEGLYTAERMRSQIWELIRGVAAGEIA